MKKFLLVLFIFLPLVAAFSQISLLKDINTSKYISRPQDVIVADNIIYYTCSMLDTCEELWRSDGTEDGTESGTTLVKVSKKAI